MDTLINQNILSFLAELAPAPMLISKHPHFIKACYDIERYYCYSPNKLIYVTGPTSAGKTVLTDLLCQRLDTEFLKLPEELRRGRLATVRIKMPVLTNVNQTFNPVIYEILRALGLNDLQRISRRSIWGSVDIMAQFAKILSERKPLVVVIDEAQNLSLVGNRWHLLRNLAHLSNLADATKVKFILVGTYDLAESLGYHPPLIRRVDLVRLENYGRSEIADFVTMAWGILKDLNIEHTLNAVKDGPYMHERSLGSYGLMHKWIQRAHIQPMLEKRQLTRADLEKENTPVPMLYSAQISTNAGREVFLETTENLKLLGQTFLDLGIEALAEAPKKRRGRGNLKPGVPKLERYPVGHLTADVRAAEACVSS